MTTNRRADDFEKALSAKGHVDPTMASLVALAGALAAIPQQPAPAFRESLRARLMSEAASMAAAPAASVPAAAVPAQVAGGSIRSFLAKPAMQAATGTLAATVAATGVGVGASRAVPGDSLYGLKRTVESVQVGLAGGALEEADALLEHVDTRLAEVRALLDRGTADALAQVRATLDDLTRDLREATAKLLDAAREGSRDAYDRLSALSRDVSARLLALLPLLPADARAAMSQAMGTLNVAAAQLRTLPVPPAAKPSPGVTPTDLPTTPTTPPVNVTTPPPVDVTTPPPVNVTTPPPVVVTTPPTVTPPPVSPPPVSPPVVLPTLPPITLPPL